MGWPFLINNSQHKVGTLDYILNKYQNSSFFEQCYIVKNCEDFPTEWLVYLALNQQNLKIVPYDCSYFLENKPCKNDFKQLLIKRLGHEKHHFLRMIIDNRYYSQSWLYYNHPTTIQGYRYISLKKCYKYVKILNKPSLYYQIKFTYYEIVESIENIFLFPDF